ncbi:hypothetical protein ACQJBY_056166 [Aegilops geniculata]
MDGIEMIDIENPDHGVGDGGDVDVKAQPDRPQVWTWIQRIFVPSHDFPNPDGLAAAAEPEQCSRYACLCYAVLVELVIITVFFTLMLLVVQFQPTTFAGRALRVMGHVVGMIGLLVAMSGFMLVCRFLTEAIIGNPEGYRLIDLLFM